jgi:hypothetical protein
LKIQLDTTKKTIKVDEDVKLSKFMSVIKRLLPHGEWMDFQLLTNTTIEHWSSPLVYRFYEPYWTYPWWGSGGTIGVYNAGTSATNLLGSSSITTTANAVNNLNMNSSSGISNNAMYVEKGNANMKAETCELKDGVYNIVV